MAVRTLKTPRLLLRQLTPDDVHDLVRAGAEAASGGSAACAASKADGGNDAAGGMSEASRRWIAASAKLDADDGGAWAVVHRLTARPIGLFIFFRGAGGRGPEIGYMMAPRWRARGLGREAVTEAVRHMSEDLGHREMFADVAVENAVSSRLLAELGFAPGEEEHAALVVGVDRRKAARWVRRVQPAALA